MNKRIALLGLLSLPFTFIAAKARASSEKYVVPKGVNLIRVRSFIDGKEVMDTNLRVNPGQIFIIEAA